MNQRKVFSTMATILFLSALALQGISQPASLALGIWGLDTVFILAALVIRESSSQEKWIDARGMLKIGLGLMVAGATLLSVAAAAQLLSASATLVDLVDVIAGASLVFGFVFEFFSYLLVRPS